jgi:nucleoside triphosphate diphosphatase
MKLENSSSRSIERLLAIMARLRHPTAGCPWDVAQSFATIAPYTIEEAYEVADACARDDMAALCDELGDLLLQTVFHARMAEERGAFAFGDVVEAICAKMERRHPHVFGLHVFGPHAVSGTGRADWEAIKAAERAENPDSSAVAGVALGLPALLRAEKLQKRAARTGFDWPDPSGPRAKVDEELIEIAECSTKEEQAEEMGDLLFAVVNWARHLDIDPEAALRSANAKFEKRFRWIEVEGGAAFSGLSLDEKEALWGQAKTRA